MSHRAKVRSEDEQPKECVELQYILASVGIIEKEPARLECCRDSREGATLPEKMGAIELIQFLIKTIYVSAERSR